MASSRRNRYAAMLATFTLLSCDSPSRPTPPPTPQLPPSTSSLDIGGSYSLTVALDGRYCATFPQVTRSRAYRAQLEGTPFGYWAVHVSGGGFPEPIVIASFGLGRDGQLSLRWNNFDLDGCGFPEPLGDGTLLYFCGSGAGSVDGTTISVALNGAAWIQEGARQPSSCAGIHQLTFIRSESAGVR